ncbi:MAG: ferredoxin [Rhodothermaceae bacterium]|nr:MAG: ferredoxin [Rhodothermaceae bacterium]
MAKLTTIEGIGEVLAEKLKQAGVTSVENLLERGSTPQGRKELAEATGIDSSRILRFVNQADLMRLKGVGSEYAELLEAAGVDTVAELARRNAANLHAKLVEINEAKKLVRQVPSLSQVEAWIAQAKELPRAVAY